MLRELHISGLGVIEDLDLELHPGLNVLTGETGTGKTMVTVGLALALGRRASATLVRNGSDAAKVQARFDAPPDGVGEDWAEDGELLLARSITSDGRSTARIGGQLSPLSALAELAPSLVEVHGEEPGLLSADGRESLELPVGSRVVIGQARRPSRFVRRDDAPAFHDLLRTKFQLPDADESRDEGRGPRAGPPVEDRMR